MANKNQINVGIELGNAYTTVAWSHTSTPDEINLIQKWPQGGNKTSDTVPSKISYTSTGDVQWGYGVGPEGRKVLIWAGFPGSPRSPTFDHPFEAAQKEGLIPSSKNPVDVVTDYLSCLRKHIIETLTQHFGSLFMGLTSINYVLTIPEAFNETSKNMILQAAESAGFGKKESIQIMMELEAAVSFILRTMGPKKMKVYDTIVIMDYGDQIANLQSYQIIASSPAIQVEEFYTSSGLCGSTFINRSFEAFLQTRIGELFDKMRPRARAVALEHFEEFLKRCFTYSGGDNNGYTCPIPGVQDNPSIGVDDGFLTLTREDMKSIFDPVINQVVSLAQDHIDMVESQDQQKSSGLVFVIIGEYGGLECLQERLRADLKSRRKKKSHKVDLVQLPNLWTVFANGAVQGTRVLRPSLRSKRYYGVEVETAFRFNEHSLENLAYCPYTGQAFCHHHIKWFIKQGERIPENYQISIPIQRRVGLNSNHAMLFTNDVFAWEQVVPKYSNQPTDSNTNILKLCTVVLDLSKVPKSSFAKTTGSTWAPHYEINYDLVLKVESDKLIIKTVFQGEEYGSITTEYLHK